MGLIKKLFGIDKIEAAVEEAQKKLDEATAKAQAAVEERARAEEQAAVAKMTPKEQATQRGEAWVGVLETHVNKENIRNGFFELDWNEFFIRDLIAAGYGFEADPQEEIVDRWFRDLARNMLAEEGIQEPNRIAAGYINVNRLNRDQSEVS